MSSHVRVLDLSAPEAWLTGQLLADMGADVHQWELPSTSSVDPYWRSAYANGKFSRVFDWQSDKSALFDKLTHTDVLIESLGRAFDQVIGVSREVLALRFPRLIHVSITGFGCEGPKAGYVTTDLVASAASGFLYLSGSPDRAPLRIGAPQAFHHAAADAAVGVHIGLAERELSGLGQHIDVSAQESTTFALLSRALDKPTGQPKAVRAAAGQQIGQVRLRSLYEAADGHVVVLQGILPPLHAFMVRLTEWLHELGFLDASLLGQPWGQSAMRMVTGAITAEQWAPIQEGLAAAIARFSKAELMEIAVERRLLVAPVLSVADILESRHAHERELVIKRFGERRLGPFARLSKSALPLTRSDGSEWKVRETHPTPNPVNAALPFAGVKVLDLFWVVAGPGSTRMLADYGATVIHVESSTRVDMIRNVPPYYGAVTDPENAAAHHTTNTNKLNLSLNLGLPEAREVLYDLVRWADVVTESFAPGAIARMGLGYDDIQRINPRAILVSSCLLGQTGAFSGYAGYGNLAAAVSGFHGLAGWPGEAPTGCFGPYTDFLAVRFNALALIRALDHQRRTGEGQFIDMAQAEASLNFLGAECARYFATGKVNTADGNRDPRCVPQGVFPVQGDDQWIALSIRSDQEWIRFCDLSADPTLRFLRALDHNARRAREDEIETAIEAWSIDADGLLLESRLQAAGIPAHRVLDTHQLFDDPQLQHREHFLPVSHNRHEGAYVESTRLILSRTRAKAPEVAPWFGVDNAEVLTGVLGYSAEKVAALDAAGVLK